MEQLPSSTIYNCSCVFIFIVGFSYKLSPGRVFVYRCVVLGYNVWTQVILTLWSVYTVWTTELRRLTALKAQMPQKWRFDVVRLETHFATIQSRDSVLPLLACKSNKYISRKATLYAWKIKHVLSTLFSRIIPQKTRQLHICKETYKITRYICENGRNKILGVFKKM